MSGVILHHQKISYKTHIFPTCRYCRITKNIICLALTKNFPMLYLILCSQPLRSTQTSILLSSDETAESHQVVVVQNHIICDNTRCEHIFYDFKSFIFYSQAQLSKLYSQFKLVNIIYFFQASVEVLRQVKKHQPSGKWQSINQPFWCCGRYYKFFTA